MLSADSRLIFILGMDRQKVAAALAVKYDKLLPYFDALSITNEGESSSREASDQLRGIEFGYAFMEKFIQVAFKVPRAQNIEAFLGNLKPKVAPSRRLPQRIYLGLIRTFTRVLGIRLANYGLGVLKTKEKALASMVNLESDDSALVPQDRQRGDAHEFSPVRELTLQLDLLPEIAGLVAPILEHNPRRIKQFVNILRLRTFIAFETGLFGRSELTLQQLAKFIAITLRWPLLLADLEHNEMLLQELEMLAVGGREAVPNPPLRTARWAARDGLLPSLRIGLPRNVEVTQAGGGEWSLATLQVRHLLEISPQVYSLIPVTESARRTGWSTRFRHPQIGEVFEDILVAVEEFSFKRIGALIVLERDISLRTFIESGVRVDAKVSRDLLLSIFQPGLPLNDGAGIIQRDRLAAAACFLPLSTSPVLARTLGTRHRAAIGITEDTDSVAVVVSEETGRISVAAFGELEGGLSIAAVKERIEQHFGLESTARGIDKVPANVPVPSTTDPSASQPPNAAKSKSESA